MNIPPRSGTRPRSPKHCGVSPFPWGSCFPVTGMQRRDENVVRVIDYMLANIGEPLVLEDLVRRQAGSQSVFERRFKRDTGMSPMRYLRHLRLDCAKRLLETTDLKVIEIAKRLIVMLVGA